MNEDFAVFLETLRSADTLDMVQSAFPFHTFHSWLAELTEATKSEVLRKKNLMIQLVSRLYMDLFGELYSKKLQIDYAKNILLTYQKQEFMLFYPLQNGDKLIVLYSIRYRSAEYLILPDHNSENDFFERVSRAMQASVFPFVWLSGNDVEVNIMYLVELVEGLIANWSPIL